MSSPSTDLTSFYPLHKISERSKLSWALLINCGNDLLAFVNDPSFFLPHLLDKLHIIVDKYFTPAVALPCYMAAARKSDGSQENPVE